MSHVDEPSSTTSESSGASHSDVEAYRSLARESRSVLDHQISFLNQMDDAAVRTVRTGIIVIGIVVSAASIVSGRNVSITVESWPIRLGIVGVIALLTSICLGIYTYRISNATLGLSRDFANEIREQQYDTIEWYDLLLGGFDEWQEQMRCELRTNARFLLAVQGLLLVGIVLLSLAVGVRLIQSKSLTHHGPLPEIK